MALATAQVQCRGLVLHWAESHACARPSHRFKHCISDSAAAHRQLLKEKSLGFTASSLQSLIPHEVQRGQARRRVVLTRSSQDVQTTPATAGSPKPKEIVTDSEPSIFKTSLGTIGVGVGVVLLSYGFGSYFQFLPGGDFSPLLLTYGFPTFLIGCALKYAELKPVNLITYADALALRPTQATAIQNQVRGDCTRFRYGDEQHLDEALKRIFRYGQAGGIPRKRAPVLATLKEEVVNARYTLTMVFDSKLPLSEWQQREAKFTSFFGPGVTAHIAEAGPNASVVEVQLIADGGPSKAA